MIGTTYRSKGELILAAMGSIDQKYRMGEYVLLIEIEIISRKELSLVIVYDQNRDPDCFSNSIWTGKCDGKCEYTNVLSDEDNGINTEENDARDIIEKLIKKVNNPEDIKKLICLPTPARLLYHGDMFVFINLERVGKYLKEFGLLCKDPDSDFPYDMYLNLQLEVKIEFYETDVYDFKFICPEITSDFPIEFLKGWKELINARKKRIEILNEEIERINKRTNNDVKLMYEMGVI